MRQDPDGHGAGGGTLTESELRAFVETMDSFVSCLRPKERLFLLTILSRAAIGRPLDLQADRFVPESAICADLVYAAWQSTALPEPFITTNPQPLPARLATPTVTHDDEIPTA